MGQLKGEIHSKIKTVGLDSLEPADRVALQTLVSNLAEYGVFIVPNGEVEDWLSYLGVRVEKSNWLSQIFLSMGTDPSHPDYVRPTAGDVWDFMGSIGRWISDVMRKGIPE